MRYKLTIEYDGTNYCGFQRQPDIVQKSICESIEKAIFNMTKERSIIYASGRTDAGVHALGQVIHFDLEREFKPYEIQSGLNFHLQENKDEISVIEVEIVDENFHSRFGGKMRHYQYLIVNRRSHLAIMKNRAYKIAKELDINLMNEAAKYLIGKHDFSSFRDSACQSKSSIKEINNLKISGDKDLIKIEISAHSFLHHMVRTIVGTLILVGIKKIKPENIKEILEAKDRKIAGPNAPACGLYFTKVDY